MSLFRRQRGPAIPSEFEVLARYNAEVSRGVAHTEEWKAKMAELQAHFNAWSKETFRNGGTLIEDPTGTYYGRLTSDGQESTR